MKEIILKPTQRESTFIEHKTKHPKPPVFGAIYSFHAPIANHEIWTTCETCGEEYDLRGVHVCK